MAAPKTCCRPTPSRPPDLSGAFAPLRLLEAGADPAQPADARQLPAALIHHFEAAQHRAGVMAGVRDGRPVVKLDEGKKRRREIELQAGALEHEMILRVLAERCAPEIKRAFQADMAHADRILLARYDDCGGWFKRHRDDAAPQTAFREFAVSINLNTEEFEGGELRFPEFGDHSLQPPGGVGDHLLVVAAARGGAGDPGQPLCRPELPVQRRGHGADGRGLGTRPTGLDGQIRVRRAVDDQVRSAADRGEGPAVGETVPDLSDLHGRDTLRALASTSIATSGLPQPRHTGIFGRSKSSMGEDHHLRKPDHGSPLAG